MKIHPPRLPSKPEPLSNARQHFIEEETLTGVRLSKDDLSSLILTSGAINESLIKSTNFTQAKLEKFASQHSLFDTCTFTATDFSDSSWQFVQIDDSRADGAQFQMAALGDVTFSSCRLELTNFRYAKLKNVVFRDCLCRETDFYGAELDNVSFERCTIERAEFSSAKSTKLDLRTSQLVDLLGIGSLGGATISPQQLIELAPSLAQELGLVIKD